MDVVIAKTQANLPLFWFHLGKAQLIHFHSPNAIFLHSLHVEAGGYEDMREPLSSVAEKKKQITFFQHLIETLTVHIELHYE